MNIKQTGFIERLQSTVRQCMYTYTYVYINIYNPKFTSNVIFTLHDSREKPVLLEKSRLVEHQLAMNYKKPDSNSRRRPKIEL